MTNPNLTEIICVVDRSGSMGAIQHDVIGGFNRFLSDQKALDKPCLLTYTQFDTVYEVVHNGLPIKEVPELTTNTYVPRGMTALHDAIGRTITEVGARLAKTPEAERPGKVVFVIITDGHENASVEFHEEKIQQMVKHQEEKYQWDFIYLAANQNARRVGRTIGTSRARNFSISDVGQTMDAMSGALGSYRVSETRCDSMNALDSMPDIEDKPPDLKVVTDSTTS